MGISLITATNVTLPALGPIFLMYMLIRTLRGEKSNNFYQCDYTSTTSSNLKSNLKTHIGEQCNKCNLCNHAASETRDLSRHMMAYCDEILTSATSANTLPLLKVIYKTTYEDICHQ